MPVNAPDRRYSITPVLTVNSCIIRDNHTALHVTTSAGCLLHKVYTIIALFTRIDPGRLGHDTDRYGFGWESASEKVI